MTAGAAAGPAQRVAALLRVLVAEALRRGRSAEGTEMRPLRQVLFASTLLGVFCALPLRGQPAAYWVQALLAYAALYTALAVVPDPQDAFERRRDLLAPLPVSPLEAALARVAFLSLVVLLLVVPLAAPSLVWMLATGKLAPWQAAGVLPATAAVAFTVAGTWLYFAFRVGRWLGIERMRRLASVLMSLLVAGTSVAGTLGLWGMGALPQQAGAELLAASPTSWPAALLFAPAAAASWWRAAAVLALALAAGLLAARTDPTVAYSGGRPGAPPGDGLVTRALAWLLRRRRDAPGRRLLPLVLFLSRAWRRDAFTAMRVRAFSVSACVLVVVELVWRPGPVALPLTVACLGFMALADGAFDLAMSSDADAAWLVETAPIDGDLLVRAMRTTVLLSRGALAAVVVAIVTGVESGPTAGVALAVAFLGAGYLLVAAIQLLRPRRPLAHQASMARGTTAIWLASPLAVASLLALVPALLAMTLPAGFDVLVAAVLAATLYAFGRGLGVLAAGRHERLVAAR